MSRSFVAIAFLAGCSGGTEPDGEELSYYRDVQPIVQRHCVRCHNPEGTGTGDFTDPQTVEVLSSVMWAKITTGEMPPPAADPECRDYVGSEHMTLSGDAVETFGAWVEAGAPMGDPASAVDATDKPLTELEDWDVEVTLEGYAPTFSDEANAGNEYRCFALEHGKTEPFYITGLAPVIDQTQVVHHIVAYKIAEEDLDEGMDTAGGVDCIDMTELGDGMLAGWAPGMNVVEFPDGYGIKVEPDERIVLQMHYFESGPDAAGTTDRSGYRLRTEPEVDRELMMVPLGLWDFTIPAGDDAYTVTESYEWDQPFPVTFWGSFPHMHVLGSGYSFSKKSPEGEESCIVRSENYDFDNQVSYLFEEPVVVRPGDEITMSCTWNNSPSNPDLIHDPPVDVRYGERTDEEMCYQFALVSLGEP